MLTPNQSISLLSLLSDSLMDNVTFGRNSTKYEREKNWSQENIKLLLPRLVFRV